MTTVSWQGRLNASSTEGEVVDVARDFVAQFDHEEVASLPEKCRPFKFMDGEDLANFAFTLVQHVTGGDTRSARLVEKLAAFFSHASFRATRLAAIADEDDRPEGRRPY